jgi:hypothetical protein
MDNRQTLESLVEMALSDYHSSDIRELASNLPEGNELSASEFADKFDMGDWVYDALIMNDINIPLLLNEIADRFEREEREQRLEDRLLATSLRENQ